MVFDAVQFSYGSLDILRGVFLKVKSGSICGLVGRNGSGKSTLMKIGVGILRPHSGNVFVGDDCVTSQRGAKRFARIAYLSQKSFLPKELHVAKILRACQAQTVLLNDPIIAPILEQKVGDISGGEKRYLELVFILGLERDFYMLDEPFTGVSPVLVEKMIKIIREKKERGQGILLTDHYTKYVALVVEDMYELQDGYCRRR